MVLTATGYVPIEAGVGGAGASASINGPSNGTSGKANQTKNGVLLIQKYSPDQPRVQAGNRDGGQWTNEGGSESSSGLDDSASNSSSRPLQYAELDTGTRSDATGTPAAVQYAGGIEDDENENRFGGVPFEEPTPGQQIRLDAARADWETLYARVSKIDLRWQPTPSIDNSIEGQIKAFEDGAQEAKEYLSRLRNLGTPRDPSTGDLVPLGAAKTGNTFIDYTTEKLMDILGEVIAMVGPRGGMDPKEYGKLVHSEFANAVGAAGLRGIDTKDIESTFGLQDDTPYGAKYSVRPDVVLRGDDGNIIAIYDVKTGTGLTKFQVIKYRLRTGSDFYVPVFDLHPGRGALWKHSYN
jgi:hypothetical protein